MPSVTENSERFFHMLNKYEFVVSYWERPLYTIDSVFINSVKRKVSGITVLH